MIWSILQLFRKKVKPFEQVYLQGNSGLWQPVETLIDTGATVSSIDVELAKKLGLFNKDNILYQAHYASALGREKRSVIGITFKLKGIVVNSRCSVADRSTRKQKFLIGRNDLKKFAVCA